jgi:cytochrome b
MAKRQLIWDLPTRVFHWSLVLSFFSAYLSGDSERWALLHTTSGYTLLGLLVFRLVWGVVGTTYARFSNFVPSPSAVFGYISSVIKGQAIHYIGHNPLGAVGILGLLLLGLICAISGWLVYAALGADWLETVHELSATIMLLLVFVHIAGVLLTSYLQRENLVKAMLTGKKIAEDSQGITKTRPVIAGLLVISILVFCWWSLRGSV